jgi:hypothetical protein
VHHEELLTGGQDIREFAARHTEEIQEVALQVEDLHRFFDRPFEQVMQRLVLDQEIPDLLRRAWRAAILEQVVEIKDARIAELEAILAAHGRAAVTDSNAAIESLKIKWIESIENEKKSAKQTGNHIGSFKTNIEPFIAFLAEHDRARLHAAELQSVALSTPSSHSSRRPDGEHTTTTPAARCTSPSTPA